RIQVRGNASQFPDSAALMEDRATRVAADDLCLETIGAARSILLVVLRYVGDRGAIYQNCNVGVVLTGTKYCLIVRYGVGAPSLPVAGRPITMLAGRCAATAAANRGPCIRVSARVY